MPSPHASKALNKGSLELYEKSWDWRRKQLPAQLIELIAGGKWSVRHTNKCNTVPACTEAQVRAIAPGESEIHLSNLPFRSLATELEHNTIYRRQLTEAGALDGVDPESFLIIADFSIGSDAMIVLDYSESTSEPVVRYLHWQDNQYPMRARWAPIAMQFSEFVHLLDLDNAANVAKYTAFR
jgi:hypothetical protein